MSYEVIETLDGFDLLDPDGSVVESYNTEPSADRAMEDAVIDTLEGPGGVREALRFLVSGHITYQT